jgi:hypothetical protein
MPPTINSCQRATNASETGATRRARPRTIARAVPDEQQPTAPDNSLAARPQGYPRPILSDHHAALKPRRQDVNRPTQLHESINVPARPNTPEQPSMATLAGYVERPRSGQ